MSSPPLAAVEEFLTPMPVPDGLIIEEMVLTRPNMMIGMEEFGRRYDIDAVDQANDDNSG